MSYGCNRDSNTRPKQTLRGSKAVGFTLIELMIAVAIVAILAAIAYPSYIEHLTKSRRASAQAFMTDAASRQQQYLLDARTYAVGDGALVALNLSVPPDIAAFYTVTVAPTTATSPPSFRLIATPVGGTSQASDGVLELDQTGHKTRAGNAGW